MRLLLLLLLFIPLPAEATEKDECYGPTTYARRKVEGKAPKGKKLFGGCKQYSKAEIILFA